MIDLRKACGLYPMLTHELYSQRRCFISRGSAATRTSFGTVSGPGALFLGTLLNAAMISSKVVGGVSRGDGYSKYSVSDRSAWGGVGKKDSANAFAFCRGSLTGSVEATFPYLTT